jgi:hypothetical protein
MPVHVLKNKTPREVRDDVTGFAPRYAVDWNGWVATPVGARPELLGRILRKWQATRPVAMRRTRAEAQHHPPFLEELFEQARIEVVRLGDLNVATVVNRSPAQEAALHALWQIFLQLPVTGQASCVGITKAVLLMTDGRIGPAFDSAVRDKLNVRPISTSSDWIRLLEHVAEDIAAFQAAHGLLSKAVPAQFADLQYGRVYDMALGPR